MLAAPVLVAINVGDAVVGIEVLGMRELFWLVGCADSSDETWDGS